MENKRNPNREFCKEIRQGERASANNACRICGLSKEVEWLQHAHIYTLSTHPKWERIGSNPIKWQNDSYVNSESNCIALCQTHHGKIDSQLGLQKVSVQYLESLKSDPNHCTALIGPIEGEWRRCKNKRHGQGNGYRCNLHVNGGHEEGLVARAWGHNKKPISKLPDKKTKNSVDKVKDKKNKNSVDKDTVKVQDKVKVQANMAKKPVAKVKDKNAKKSAVKVTDKTKNPVAKVTDQKTKKPIAKVTDQKTKKSIAKVTDEKIKKPIAKVTHEKTKKPVAKVTDKKTKKPVAKVTDKKIKKPVDKAPNKKPKKHHILLAK